MLRAEALEGQHGGILADEPGTGKTVTTLALLCKTAGVRTAPLPDAAAQCIERAESLCSALPIEFKREVVLKVLRDVRERCPEGFQPFASPATRVCGGRGAALDFVQLARDEIISTFATCCYS